MRGRAFLFIVLLLAVTGCVEAGYPTAGISTPVSGIPTDSVSEISTPVLENPTETESQPSSTPVAVPTATSTATPSQQVYDPAQLGDLSKLESYAVTSQHRNQKGTDPNNGDGLRIDQWNLTVINTPLQFHLIASYERSKIADRADEKQIECQYLFGNMIYRQIEGVNYWQIKPESEYDRYYLDSFANTLSYIKSARFVGQEVFNGIPANHFSFDQTDWVSDEAEAVQYKIDSMQGNIYLAQQDNYPLHLDFKLVGDVWWVPQTDPKGYVIDFTYVPGIEDVVYDISSINQLTEIALPEDFPTQINLDVDVPLPGEVQLGSIMVFNDRTSYEYETDLSHEEILAFYKSFQPTNGWTVDNAGEDPSGELVMLGKNNRTIFLTIEYNEFDQKNTIEFQYAP